MDQVFSRSDDVRHHNRRRILNAVRRGGISSRTDIGEVTGLSAATISAITSDLLDEGLLHPPTSKAIKAMGRGRPKVALQMNSNAGMICSIYFQLNLITAALVDYAGNEICDYTVEISTKDITASEIKFALISCIEEAMKIAKRGGNLRRIAVGFQGVADVEGKTVIWSPICTQRDIPIQHWLETHFGVPSRVANDCDMIAQALNWRDPIKYGENFAAILLAHGVGMGLFLRRNIINGVRSSGNEFGHMSYIPNGALCRCGNRGCIEAYAGDYAISRHAKGEAENTAPSELLDLQNLDAIATVARAGDLKAITAIENAGAAIGTGLASLFALVDAFPIVLVGPGASLFDLMETSLRAALETSPGLNQLHSLEIDCYPDEISLVRQGCTISALMLQDAEMAQHRSNSRVVNAVEAMI
ncbi:MAG: ROK family transcriptional regulator [Rhizobiaceae bacterium]